MEPGFSSKDKAEYTTFSSALRGGMGFKPRPPPQKMSKLLKHLNAQLSLLLDHWACYY